MVEPNRDKATVIALREIASGKVGTEVLKRGATPSSPPGL
jgi:DNA-directed RNA polymerase subunit K/omega